MINVRAAANAAVQVVNPNIDGVFYGSTGFTVNAAKKQVPSYAAPLPVSIQVQAVSARKIDHLEKLNIQGALRSVHMWGNTQGVVRVNQQGGDLLYFPETPGTPSKVWLVVDVVETWRDWSHVVVNLQTDTAPPA